MTFSAFGGHTDTVGWNPIGSLAMRASNDMCGFVVHFSFPGIWIFCIK
jgi:hypothetical protein